ncbi:MAG TPA: single-stranded-DNA-specific exonuclease RecJ [Rhizomicrobium sp.]|jgi:single-stranded-DNA-specific exonuclease|nr:single-stranded-DNA-specific exonuclease RecJ [Rhizomicrobium sp.]
MLAEAAHVENTAAFGVARSFSGRSWTLRHAPDDAVRALALRWNISPLMARLLVARGMPDGEMESFLNPTLKQLLPEPRALKDVDKAVARLCLAIERNEKIAVFGDYDVDGSCSSALMSEFLTALGRKPRIYIPDRLTEGYGPSAAAFATLKNEGASVIVTVDCGAAATAALQSARDAGVDVVVLDHHAIETAPPAFAQVNPNQPGDTSGLGHLCAAGVTFVFLVALNRELRDSGWYAANSVAEPDLRDSLDLVGLATICDVVPLVGVNRAFVRAGLARLSILARPAIRALAEIAGIAPPFTPYHLGFLFGPRINAGGRVGKCSLGAELLIERDPDRAAELAALLDVHNKERQALERLILEEALVMGALQANAPFVLVHGEGWHSGVVGIVAGRLKERFNKPALVAGFEGGMGRGSARSIPGIDIGAMIRAAHAGGHLHSGGGHAMAAGFSLDAAKLDVFREFLELRFNGHGEAFDAASELALDLAISPRGATPDLVNEIARVGPFGAGNPEPLLVAPDVRVAFADVVGKDHVRLRLEGGDGARLDAIAFRAASAPLGEALLAARGQRIHAAGKLKIDDWNGRVRVQFIVEDAAPAVA